MNDNEIAQALVEVGIAWCSHGEFYNLAGTCHDPVSAFAFVRDPRVAMAVMERVIEWGGWDRICSNTTEDFLATCYRGYANKRHIHNVVNESLPRAIIEAGAQALETEK